MSLNILNKNKKYKLENYEIYWFLDNYNLTLNITVKNKKLIELINFEFYLYKPKEWNHIMLENNNTKCVYVWDLRRIKNKLYLKNFDNLNNKLTHISI